jgi:WD40 repeat protein
MKLSIYFVFVIICIAIFACSAVEKSKESDISTRCIGDIIVRLMDGDEDTYYIKQKDSLQIRSVNIVSNKIAFEGKHISRTSQDSIGTFKAQAYLQETNVSPFFKNISANKSLTLATDGQLLIDYSKETIDYLPIRILRINLVAWSDDNQYLFAPTNYLPDSEFHIINTKENVSVAKKKLDEYIIDAEFSPDSKQIALLCITSKVRHKYPWDYYASTIGHPISLVTFHLRIFDLTGTEVFNHEVGNSIPNGLGQLIWIKEKD